MNTLRSNMAGKQKGMTLLEVLVALLLGSVVMAATVSNFTDAWRRAKDNRLISEAETEARTILDVMTYDLRMVGTGMPLTQSGFAIDDATLGTASHPILTSSTATKIVFRLNEKGTSTVLTSAYTPSNANRTFSVFSSSGFTIGKDLYISNMPVLGTSGMRGTVSSIVGNSITVSSGYTATLGSSFSAGSTVEPVSLVTYNSPSNGSGITRNSGSTDVLLSPRSSFSAEYLDSNGNALTLPLTTALIKTSLYSIRLTVSVKTSSRVQGGGIYTAQGRQTVALRNLNLAR